MAAWDIEPDGVAAVVAAARAVGTELATEATTIRADVDAAAGASGSGPVSAALADFAAAQSRHLDDVFTRAESCATAATRATAAYVAGDEEMAANAQAAARSVPELLSLLGSR